VPEVLKRTREALRMGATQIKINSGGGVFSSFDPLDVTQFTIQETRAAVDAAACSSELAAFRKVKKPKNNALCPTMKDVLV
jgi:hypothetical protein